jgi:hypothetical protein
MMNLVSLTSVLGLSLFGGCSTPKPYSCDIPFGNSDTTLLNNGGAEDSPQFDDYSFSSSIGGNTFILDPLAKRILSLKTTGGECKVTLALTLPNNLNVVSIAVINDRIYSLLSNGDVRPIANVNSGRQVSLFEPTHPGELAQSMSDDDLTAARLTMGFDLPVLNDRRATAAGSTEGNDIERRPGELGATEDSNRILSSSELPIFLGNDGKFHAYRITRSSDSAFQLVIYEDRAGVKAQFAANLRVPRYLGAVEVAGSTRTGDVVIIAEDFALSAQKHIGVDLAIFRLTNSGTLIAAWSMKFPLAGKAPLWPTDSDVRLSSRSEDMIQLRLKTGNSQVLREQRYDDLPKLEIPASVALESKRLVPTEAASITARRKEVIGRAEKFLTLSWAVRNSNLESAATQGCEPPERNWLLPLYLRSRNAGDTAFGVPYNWGGKEDIDTIAERLTKGAVAGNVCCRDFIDPRSGKPTTTVNPMATGIDCSGFVSRVWNLRSKSGVPIGAGTSTLATYSNSIDSLTSLQPGDALNLPSNHVRLFSSWVDTVRGLRIRTYESTAASLCSGVCQRDLRIRAFLDYEPRQFKEGYGEP